MKHEKRIRKERRCKYSFFLSTTRRRISMKLKTFTGCLFLPPSTSSSLNPHGCPPLPTSRCLSFPLFSYDAFSRREEPNEKRTKRHLDLSKSISLFLTRHGGSRLISRWLIKNSFAYMTGCRPLMLIRHVEKWIHACGLQNSKRWNARLQSKVFSAYTKKNLTIKFIELGKFARFSGNRKLLFMI